MQIPWSLSELLLSFKTWEALILRAALVFYKGQLGSTGRLVELQYGKLPHDDFVFRDASDLIIIFPNNIFRHRIKAVNCFILQREWSIRNSRRELEICRKRQREVESGDCYPPKGLWCTGRKTWLTRDCRMVEWQLICLFVLPANTPHVTNQMGSLVLSPSSGLLSTRTGFHGHRQTERPDLIAETEPLLA